MRRWRGESGLVLLGLLVLAATSLGSSCNKPGAGGFEASVRFEPPLPSLEVGGYLDLDVVAEVSEGEIQAFELDASVPPALLWIIGAEPRDLGEGGFFFVPPGFDVVAGRVDRMVAYERGLPGESGEVVLARLRIFGIAPGSATLDLPKARLSGPGGEAFDVDVTPAEIQVVPAP